MNVFVREGLRKRVDLLRDNKLPDYRYDNTYNNIWGSIKYGVLYDILANLKDAYKKYRKMNDKDMFH